MRLDSRGLPDVCRETFTPVHPDAQEAIKYVKLSTNALIAFCRTQIDGTLNPETRRWFALAATAFEEASCWAIKGITYEEWVPRKNVDTVIDPPATDKHLKK